MAGYPMESFCVCGSLRAGSLVAAVLTLAAGAVGIWATLLLHYSYGYVVGERLI